MSRVYFHSEHGEAELRGSERAWLNWIARGPARAYWGLDRASSFDRVKEIMAMVPRAALGDRHSYLHSYLEKALAEEAENKRLYAARRPTDPWPNTYYDEERRMGQALETALSVEGVPMEVAGVRLHTANIELNTALAMGSEHLALAAKIHGWCESHCWVDGPDRKWMADVMDAGLKAGIYRRGIWYEDSPGADKQWSSQGWEEVIAFLRSRDEGPVVLSYSVGDSFPNREVAGWEPPFEQGWKPDWADDAEGLAEWEATEDKDEYQRETRGDEWYELPFEQRWSMAFAGLQQLRPWAQIAPDNLLSTTFATPVTIFDLFAPDRDERVLAAARSLREDE